MSPSKRFAGFDFIEEEQFSNMLGFALLCQDAEHGCPNPSAKTKASPRSGRFLCGHCRLKEELSYHA